MSKMEQLMKQWDNLNEEITEITCLSRIVEYCLYEGENDEIVRLNIAGVATMLSRNIDEMQNKYMALLREVQAEMDKA